jgi:hypothetical protein
MEETREVARTLTDGRRREEHHGTIYIVAGTKIRLTSPEHAARLAADASCTCVLDVIEGGNHVVNDFWYRYRDQTAYWMATQLGVAKRWGRNMRARGELYGT